MSKILLYQIKFQLLLISATRKLTFTSNIVNRQTKNLPKGRADKLILFYNFCGW